ncbi:MAG: TonB-dependent receptor, partial [Gammaproteobacteria bacterium]|nr:TonB-dependent receptor [Gammaproteobacteria bacterium]
LVSAGFIAIPQVHAQIEEIVVTAQKREQSAQDIPIAITAFTRERVQELGFNEPGDIAQHVPNLDVKNTLGFSNPIVTIRGIGVNDFQANADQSAGVYVDEVFMASSAMLAFQLFDIERVEVLKGPQGTLYGRNTTAGAVSFVSRRPTREFEGDLTVGYANYERLDAEGHISGPVGEQAAGRLAFTTTQSNGGHINNLLTGNSDYGQLDRWAVRGSLDFQFGDNVDVNLTANTGQDDSDAGTTWKMIGVVDPMTFGTCAPALAGDFAATRNQCIDFLGFQDQNPDPYTGSWNKATKLDAEQHGLALRVNVDLGRTTLTSVTGYQGYERFLGEDADGSPARYIDIEYKNKIDQLSQELRLSSNEPFRPAGSDSEIHWIAGAFYHFDEREGTPNQAIDTFDFVNDLLVTAWTQDTDSAALFGHLEWRLSTQWQLAFGARETWERKRFDGSSVSNPFPGGSGFTGLTTPFVFAANNQEIDDTAFTGDVALEWTPNDASLIYLKFSKGFKSGGFNGGFASSNPELEPFDPEKLMAYELGFKSTLLDGTMQLNSAFFYYDYKDQQLFAVPTDALIPTIRLTNAEKAEIIGIDAEMQWRPIERLDVIAGLGWLDTENQDPRFAGLELPNAPELTFNGLVRYEIPLRNGIMLAPSVDFTFTDEMFKTIDNKPLLRSDSFWISNARLTATLSEKWEFMVWVKNLGDIEYIVEAFDQEATGQMIYNYNLPRTYGISVSRRW